VLHKTPAVPCTLCFLHNPAQRLLCHGWILGCWHSTGAGGLRVPGDSHLHVPGLVGRGSHRRSAGGHRCVRAPSPWSSFRLPPSHKISFIKSSDAHRCPRIFGHTSPPADLKFPGLAAPILRSYLANRLRKRPGTPGEVLHPDLPLSIRKILGRRRPETTRGERPSALPIPEDSQVHDPLCELVIQPHTRQRKACCGPRAVRDRQRRLVGKHVRRREHDLERAGLLHGKGRRTVVGLGIGSVPR